MSTKIRLQKALAQAGIASRRKAEELIDSGVVKVNGQVVREQGVQVDPSRDLIQVNGRLLEREKKVYFVLYKPPEVVTTLSDPQERETVAQFFKGIRERVFAVGRLDYDAEGALIVTNDGDLANKLMHPRYEVPRVYLAKVKGTPDKETLEHAQKGVRLDDGFVKPVEVEAGETAEKNTWVKLVLTEGRPHLVKRFFAAIGHPVVRLYRPMYGGISAEGLRPGEIRPLTSVEISRLMNGGKAPIPKIANIKAPPRRHRADDEGVPQETGAVFTDAMEEDLFEDDGDVKGHRNNASKIGGNRSAKIKTGSAIGFKGRGKVVGGKRGFKGQEESATREWKVVNTHAHERLMTQKREAQIQKARAEGRIPSMEIDFRGSKGVASSDRFRNVSQVGGFKGSSGKHFGKSSAHSGNGTKNFPGRKSPMNRGGRGRGFGRNKG